MDNVLCETCGIKQCKGSCGCKKSCCKKSCCGEAKPVVDVQALPDDILTLSFNFNGVGTTYDYSSMIKQGQTDTSISANSIDRVLKYMAERHTDTISARELGAILHIADIGDVDIEDVDANSLFVYQKNSDCSRGCDGTTNQWVGWSALNHLADSFQYVMGYGSEGEPLAMNAPANTNQYYQLGWNAAGKVGWKQPKKVTSTTNLAQVYIDKTTKELVYVES